VSAFCEFCKFYLKISGVVLQFASTLLILSFYCSAHALSLSLDDEAARDGALQWLRIVDSGNYEEAALQMSQEIRALQNWVSYFAAHRGPLGRVKNRQIVEVKHRSSVPGTAEIRNHDIMRFKTSFEHKPGALEEVLMTKMGCCWEVSGYKIFRSEPDGR
jgi:hypothetical protein